MLLVNPQFVMIMYNFIFYFFYRIFNGRKEDPEFYSLIATFLIIVLHLATVMKVLDYFGVMDFPNFSDTYLYNKLYYYIPLAVVLGIVWLFYGKSRKKSIIQKYSSRDVFYSFGNILLFVLHFAIPITIVCIIFNESPS